MSETPMILIEFKPVAKLSFTHSVGYLRLINCCDVSTTYTTTLGIHETDADESSNSGIHRWAFLCA